MKAYQAMVTILDINETIEKLKNKNTSSEPDLVICKTCDLLDSYRDLLCNEMMKTDLGAKYEDN